jgi:transposase
MEAGKERLTLDTVRDASSQEIEHLKRENHDLKQLVADLSLEARRFKKRPSQLSMGPQAHEY